MAQELQGSGNNDETKTDKEQVNEDLEGLELGTSQDLVQSLGLDISSSSADESSPIKKQQKTENRKKRKRPHLGFSAPTGPETFHSPAKRKNVSK